VRYPEWSVFRIWPSRAAIAIAGARTATTDSVSQGSLVIGDSSAVLDIDTDL
jgi:hypothetical protein